MTIEVSANHPSHAQMNTHNWMGIGPRPTPEHSPLQTIWCTECGRSFYDPPIRCPSRVVAHWNDIPPRWRHIPPRGGC